MSIDYSGIVMWTAIVSALMMVLFIIVFIVLSGETPKIKDEIDRAIGRKEEDK